MSILRAIALGMFLGLLVLTTQLGLIRILEALWRKLR